MDMEVGDSRGPSSPGSTKNNKSSSPPDLGCRRGEIDGKKFARHDYEETVAAQRAPVRGILVYVGSTSVKPRREFPNLDFNAAITIRQRAVLSTRPERLLLSNFVIQPRKLEGGERNLSRYRGLVERAWRPAVGRNFLPYGRGLFMSIFVPKLTSRVRRTPGTRRDALFFPSI
jgi:hypothetical protein